MSYFSNITNDELQYFHGLKVPNFTIKLSDILHKTSDVFDNKLFLIEEIVTDSIYRIFPIFYTNTISSTNPNDSIIEDKVIICTVEDSETFITFISDESEPVQDYISYGTYFEIGDTLTLSEFNSIVQLLRANTIHKDSFELHEGITHGNYADYELTIDGLFVDNGVEIVSLTDLKMKLLNPVFKWSKYTLKLKALRITNPNVDIDDSVDGKTLIDVNVELEKDAFVDIPITDLENGDIILYDATVEITHDKPVIHYFSDFRITANPNPIQSGEVTDIYAQLLDIDGEDYDINDADDITVYFYEKLTPSISISASANVIQSGDDVEIYADVRDTDGSIAKNVPVHFYKAEGNYYEIIREWNSSGYTTEYYNTPIEITGQMKKNGDWGGLRIYGEDSDYRYVYLGQGQATNDENAKKFYKIGSDWTNFKITIGNNEVKLYINDTLNDTIQTDTSEAVSVWGGSSSNKVSVRNVKIKPL